MGKVKVQFRGAPRATVKHLIIGQKVGAEKIFFLNLGESRGAQEVPVGAYIFKYALITQGSNPERGLRIEVRRGTFPSFKVEEGKTHTVTFGGPFKVNYPVSVDPATGEAEIQTYKMGIWGEKGELYINHWDKVFAPDYQVRDKDGRLAHKGRFRCFSETDELEPSGVGAEILYSHPHNVVFKAKGSAPFKVEISIVSPLLGKVRTPGYK